MKYPEINIPVSNNLQNLNKEEAKNYNLWFVKNIEKRIKVLEEYVKSDKNHRFWHANYSRTSIKELGEWLFNNLSERDYPKKELEKDIIENKYPNWFADIAREQLGGKVFSDETYRKCFDIGIYFGESLRVSVPSLKWDYLMSKNFVYKNQPILLLDDRDSNILSPRDIVQGVAGKFMRNEVASDNLLDIYDIWNNLFTEQAQPI